ncbi:MAG: hypothetical protein KDJ30_05915, partial [Rhodoblastus sp.]|nr:hypothetical protein [Rhodoblastus sp.]
MTKKFLLVGVMTPALLVGQVAQSFAGAGVIELAQAQLDQKHPPSAHKPAAAPRGAVQAPRIAPSVQPRS